MRQIIAKLEKTRDLAARCDPRYKPREIVSPINANQRSDQSQ
jgi:hypothetical protein